MTFWCRYWSRDRSRDHFGLENGLETSLVTLGSVTFWSQNGLETGLRPFWSQKWSRDLVSSLSDGMDHKICDFFVLFFDRHYKHAPVLDVPSTLTTMSRSALTYLSNTFR